jgi:F5/8 type C domain
VDILISNFSGANYHFNKNYWVWKRWVPIMVDVTPWAGRTVTIQFRTTGNDVWGWTTWGSPAVYQSTATNNNLALGKSVTVSSTDGEGVGWDPSFITDGNVDGGIAGRNGWSSVSHSSPSASEWAVIDLGSSQSIGKIVLFARSDLVDFAGTGFPTGLQIQVSQDSNTWTTLVNENNYPGAKAGEGQIFTFPQASARYVRILGTALGGVGTESGYRIQLGEVEIFA